MPEGLLDGNVFTLETTTWVFVVSIKFQCEISKNSFLFFITKINVGIILGLQHILLYSGLMFFIDHFS